MSAGRSGVTAASVPAIAGGVRASVRPGRRPGAAPGGHRQRDERRRGRCTLGSRSWSSGVEPRREGLGGSASSSWSDGCRHASFAAVGQHGGALGAGGLGTIGGAARRAAPRRSPRLPERQASGRGTRSRPGPRHRTDGAPRTRRSVKRRRGPARPGEPTGSRRCGGSLNQTSSRTARLTRTRAGPPADPRSRRWPGIPFDRTRCRRKYQRPLPSRAAVHRGPRGQEAARLPRNRPSERPPHHLEDLGHVLVGLAPLGGRPDAALTWSSRTRTASASTAARSADVCWRMSTQYSSRSIIRAMPRTWPSIRLRRRTS